MIKYSKFMKKSQIALEFVLFFSIAIFVMTVLLVTFYEINKNTVDEKITMKMDDFHYSIQSELILASQMNDGYVRSFSLPSSLENTDYNMSIINNNIVLSYNGLTHYKKIPYTIGNLVKGTNTLTKTNNTIYLNQ